MIDQANWMSKNKETILNKSVKLYELIVNGDQQNKLRERVAPRCCDFTLLEKQSLGYQVKDFEKDFEDLEKVSKEVFENALNSKFSGFYYTVNKDFIAAFDNSSEETEVNNESFEREEFFNVSELRSWSDAKKDENKRQLLRASELTPFSPL